MLGTKLNEIGKIQNRDSLWIGRGAKRGNRQCRIKCNATVVTFKDRDTKQMIMYVPSLELSGYGDNIIEAQKMLNFEVNELFTFFSRLTGEQLKAELAKLKWVQDRYLHKEFSSSYIDIDGNLQNFNIEENSKVDVVQQQLVHAE